VLVLVLANTFLIKKNFKIKHSIQEHFFLFKNKEKKAKNHIILLLFVSLVSLNSIFAFFLVSL
jgi:hypothetical protein